MGRIADYLAESLTEKELSMLWDFIRTGKPAEDMYSLVRLRLAEASEEDKQFELTPLGKDVADRLHPCKVADPSLKVN